MKELGFKAAHLALHWFDMQPNDKRLYPIYEKCLELGVPDRDAAWGRASAFRRA